MAHCKSGIKDLKIIKGFQLSGINKNSTEWSELSYGARGVMVIVTGYGHGDTSSNPGPDWLHFT